MLKRELYYNIFLFAAAIVPIMIFSQANEYHKIERYFYNTNKWCYIAIQISYYILVLAAIVNARYFVFDVVHLVYKRVTKKK
jgi:hypothetical protein